MKRTIRMINTGHGSVQVGGNVIFVGGRGSTMVQSAMLVGNGKAATQHRDLSGSFNALDVRGLAETTWTRSDAITCEVRWDENLLEHVVTEVHEGVLYIDITQGLSISSAGPMNVAITGPELQEASVSGSGGLTLRDIQQDALSIEVSGSGDVKADGVVKELQVEVSGSGDIKARKLKAAQASVKVSGSGDAKVSASESVKVRVSGSADVVVCGAPKKRDVRVTGSGDVEFED